MEQRMEPPLRKLHSIKFDLMSSEEIKNYSGIEINESKQTGTGSISDTRMGIDTKHEKCATCDETYINCPGHFGYIKLNVPIFNPLYIEKVMTYLSFHCIFCFKFLLKPDVIKLYSNSDSVSIKFLSKIVAKLKNCPFCSEDLPKYTIIEDDIFYHYDNKKTERKTKIEVTAEYVLNNFVPRERDILKKKLSQFKFIFRIEPYIITELPLLPPAARASVILSDNEESKGYDDLSYKYIDILKVNNNLSKKISSKDKQEFVRNLKFHVKTMFDNSKGKAKQYFGTRPIKCIKSRWTGKSSRFRGNIQGKRVNFSARTVFDVDPNLDIGDVGLPDEYYERITFPEIVYDRNRKELENMIKSGKVSRVIREKGEKDEKPAIYSKKFEEIKNNKLNYGDLVFRVKTIMLIRNDPVCSRFISSLFKARLIKKEDVDKIIKDKIITVNKDKSITIKKSGTTIRYTEIINPETYELLRGKKFELQVDDKIRSLDKTAKLKWIKSLPESKKIELKDGDIVERFIRDGDYLVFNRQPSLHKFSMMAGKAKRIHSKTMRLNVANCSMLNADADGDELNNHFPQDLMSKVELKELLNISNNLTSGRDCGVVIGICQDTITGGYRSTKPLYRKGKLIDELGTCIEKDDFFQIINQIDWNIDIFEKMNHIKHVMKKHKINKKYLYSGRGLFSMLLPDDLEITYELDKKTGLKAVITEGVLISGYIDKSIVGKKAGSLIQILGLYYSFEIGERFATNYQRIYDHWNLLIGFSIGLQDCVSKDIVVSDERNEKKEGAAFHQAQKAITDCFIQAKMIIETEKDPRIREIKINGKLNEANSIGDKIAKDSLHHDNAFVDMIKSGAKGNWVNIPQIITGVGQQNVDGKRIQKTFKDRTLPHYRKNKSDFVDPFGDEIESLNEIFESRGFIRNSLLKGLNPKEFFFFSCASREGVISTSTKTQITGYITRRLVKKLENVKISYFNTATASHEKIYQFEYNDGLDPAMCQVIGNQAQFCNVKILIDKENKQFEIENGI